MIELITNKDGLKIPKVDGICLHSLVDPVRESIRNVNEFETSLKQARYIIVFGLGGGFHVEELKRRFSAEITVIEASSEIAQAVIENNPRLIDSQNLLIGQSFDALLNNDAFIDSFSDRFAVYQHTPSIRLFTEYYKKILHEIHGRKLSTLKSLALHNPELTRLLSGMEREEFDLKEISNELDQKEEISQAGLVFKLMRELIV